MESTGWALWWVWMWSLVSVALLLLIYPLTFKPWATAAAIWFGVPEIIGILNRNDAYPPLTHVISRYVPRWIAFSLIYAFTGFAAAHWLGYERRVAAALLVGLLGWFTTHFDVAFDAEMRQQERAKYERIGSGIRSLVSRF